VELDKWDIDQCDVVLAYAWQPSAGTSMEVLYAWEGSKKPYWESKVERVVLVIPEHLRISPWYRYHSSVILPTLDDASLWIRQFTGEDACPDCKELVTR
jgi:hypothetical protein